MTTSSASPDALRSVREPADESTELATLGARASRRARLHAVTTEPPDPQQALAHAVRRDARGLVVRLPPKGTPDDDGAREPDDDDGAGPRFTGTFTSAVRWHMPSEIAGRTWEAGEYPPDERAAILEVVVPTLRHYAAVLDNRPSPIAPERVALATPEALRGWLVDLTPAHCWPGKLVTPDGVAAAWWQGLSEGERVTLAAYVCAHLAGWQAMDAPLPPKPKQPAPKTAPVFSALARAARPTRTQQTKRTKNTQRTVDLKAAPPRGRTTPALWATPT